MRCECDAIRGTVAPKILDANAMRSIAFAPHLVMRLVSHWLFRGPLIYITLTISDMKFCLTSCYEVFYTEVDIQHFFGNMIYVVACIRLGYLSIVYKFWCGIDAVRCDAIRSAVAPKFLDANAMRSIAFASHRPGAKIDAIRCLASVLSNYTIYPHSI